MTPRLLNLLTLLGLVGLLAGISLTAPHWARFLSRSEVEAEEGVMSDATPESPRPTPEAVAEATRSISVKLFFEAADRRGLATEDRTVTFSSDLPRQIRLVTEELIAGSRKGLVSPHNPTTRVLEVFVSDRGVAYLDLSKELRDGLPGGSEAERLAVYSIVNSVVENFPAVRRVQILVDDRPVETLSGHIDLSRPLSADMTLLADLQAPPLETPAPVPSPAARSVP